MQVSKIQKKHRVDKYDLVRYQIITELVFMHKQALIPVDIEILTLLSLWGPMELSKFCNSVAKKLYTVIEVEQFSIRAQNIRNRVTKLEKRGFIVKSNDKKKLVTINPTLNIVMNGNILLVYNFLSIETA